MTWGERIYNAIELRDATVLRVMADEAQREEARLLLKLLADMIDRDPNESLQFKSSAPAWSRQSKANSVARGQAVERT